MKSNNAKKRKCAKNECRKGVVDINPADAVKEMASHAEEMVGKYRGASEKLSEVLKFLVECLDGAQKERDAILTLVKSIAGGDVKADAAMKIDSAKCKDIAGEIGRMIEKGRDPGFREFLLNAAQIIVDSSSS